MSRGRTFLLNQLGSGNGAGGGAGQVAFFTGPFTLGSEAAFKYDDLTNTLTVDSVASNTGAALTLSGTAPTSGAGVNVSLLASDAISGNGGDVYLYAGNRVASGRTGSVFAGENSAAMLTGVTRTNGLPTSDSVGRALILAGGNSRFYDFTFRSGAIEHGFVSFKSDSSTVGTLSANAADDPIGIFAAKGAASATAWDTAVAGMYVLTGETQTATNQGRYIQFRAVANGSTSQTNAWRIASSPVGDFVPETDDAYRIGSGTLGIKQLHAAYTDTSGGVTGNRTINKMAGSVNFAAAMTTLVVTNSVVTTSSKVFASISTSGSTGVLGSIVPGSGSFAINMSTAPNAETRVHWFVLSAN